MARKKSSLGVMRDIDLDAIIADAVHTIEDSEHENEIVSSPPKASRRTTRASRTTGNPMPIYSSKYHPMDHVTRPNSAQVRRRSMAVSSATREREYEDEDDDESLALTSSQTLPDEEDDSEASQDGIIPRKSRNRFELTLRTPHPKSTRRSSRKEAKKFVPYSTKHHPQDDALRGYRHRATEMVDSSTEATLGSLKRKARQQEDIEHPEDNSADEVPAKVHQRPRKKLKSLGRGNAKPMTASSGNARANTPIHVESDTSDLSDVDEELISGPQPTKWTSVTEDNIEPEHHVVEALDDNNPRLAEFRRLLGPLSRLEDYANRLRPLYSGAKAGSVTPPPTAAPHVDYVPEYIKCRITLSGGDPTSLTTATLLDTMLADYRSGSHGTLSIHRPYINSIPSTEEGNPTEQRSGQDTTGELPLYPYLGAIAEVSEFEEQMAITESSRVSWHAINTQPPAAESSQLATSDPIHLLMTQPPIVDDEDLPSTAEPSPARSILRNQ